jgi:hypothetical protein
MPDTFETEDDADAWVIPLHGIDAPAADILPFPTRPEWPPVPEAHLFNDWDDEQPTIEFRPQLRRSA